jgi:hypothetical protein
MNRVRRGLISLAVLSALGGTAAEGQNPAEGFDLSVRSLRPSGQPIVPAFEGWYRLTDGSYRLCFGYWSANTVAAVDIPIGPDNSIEPSEYNGQQPTHFRPVPVTGSRRHYCVFSIRVPADFGDQRVIWTLRFQKPDRSYNEFSAEGHLGSTAYLLDEPDSPSRATGFDLLRQETGITDYSQIKPEDLETWMNFDPGQTQGSIAPVMRFVQPAGPEGRGRDGITAGPVRASVGQPVTLSVFVDAPDERPARWWVGWSKFQGPGDVSFSQYEMVADYRYENRATTRATFTEPGTYTILVQALENIQSWERQCCWTNGYVRVEVTR